MKKRSNKTYHGVFAVQRKNWDPFVPGPAFAIDKTPAKQNKKGKYFKTFSIQLPQYLFPKLELATGPSDQLNFFFTPPPITFCWTNVGGKID